MKIGPVDIRNHTFAKKMRGVDDAEVRAYLDLVADRLEEEILEREDLRTQIDKMEAQLGEYRTLEKTMRDSLVSAERVADDKLVHAEKEARIVMKNAEIEAERIVVGARNEIGRLRADLDDLRRQKITYVERFRALLRSQVKILEATVDSFDSENGFSEVMEVLQEPRPPASPQVLPSPEAHHPPAPARPAPTTQPDPTGYSGSHLASAPPAGPADGPLFAPPAPEADPNRPSED